MGIRVEPNAINISGTTNIWEVYVWGTKIRPSDNWTLYDETILANSQWWGWTLATLNWKICRTDFWFYDGNWHYSIWTRTLWADTYDVVIPYDSHWQFSAWLPNAYWSELFSHNRVKLVIDYMYVTPSWSYWEWAWLHSNTAINWWMISWSWGVKQTTWLWLNYDADTPYTIEYVFDTSDMTDIYTEYKLTNLNNNTSVTWSFIWHPHIETDPHYILVAWPRLVEVAMDQWNWQWHSYMWNIHLYYKD